MSIRKQANGKYLVEIYLNNNLNAENYVWVLASNQPTRNLYSPVRNIQYAASLLFAAKKWNASASFFHKNISGIPSRIIADNLYNPYTKTTLKVDGLEFFLQRKSKNDYSILSYTFTKIELDIAEDLTIPPEYNIPHQLKILQGIKYKNINFSTSYNLSSGLPYTPYDKIEKKTDPDGSIYHELVFSKFNSRRLATYHRLDLTLSYARSFKKLHSKFSISLINALNAPNILSRNFQIQEANPDLNHELKVIEKNKFGLKRLLNVGLKLRWGA